jgi:putative peptidoglycan lipid II flippase
VIAASALLAVLLLWGSQHFDWVGLRSNGCCAQRCWPP